MLLRHCCVLIDIFFKGLHFSFQFSDVMIKTTYLHIHLMTNMRMIVTNSIMNCISHLND